MKKRIQGKAKCIEKEIKLPLKQSTLTSAFYKKSLEDNLLKTDIMTEQKIDKRHVEQSGKSQMKFELLTKVCTTYTGNFLRSILLFNMFILNRTNNIKSQRRVLKISRHLLEK